MAYNPNQAGLFNRLIQSGLNTANAALQAGITSTKDFALGDNGNLGGLIPGANAVPATAQTVFQSVRFAETASGQPIQLAALATNAAPIAVPQTIVIPPAPVTGLDLTVPGQLVQAPGELGRGTTAPEVVTAAQLGTQAFPSTVNPALAEPAPQTQPGTGFGDDDTSVFPTTSPAPQTQPGTGFGDDDTSVFPTTSPAPQTTIFNIQAPGELGRSISAPSPADINTAGLPIFNDEGQVVQGIRKNPEDGTTYYTEPPFSPANESAAESNRLANQQAAAEANTIQQATLQSTFKQPGNGDWRFRISLAENANYLYSIINNSEKGGGAGAANSGPGILAPLANTGGVIFPYTPSVTSSYQARYSTYELVHSNYRGAFYQSSFVGDINIRGVFTAQDTTEAAYMLAVIHFFRSVTKMFYGQDAQRGAPPPLVFLTGLGDYQYNRHPAVVTQFDYTLPNDVDYIRATNPNNFGTDLLNRRTPTAASPVKSISAIGTRLLNALLTPGAESAPPSRAPITNSVTNTARATYVPTKIEISVTLMPMQTRDQVSKQFSLEKFANGSLLSGGFW
jgi:hypothetical protein